MRRAGYHHYGAKPFTPAQLRLIDRIEGRSIGYDRMTREFYLIPDGGVVDPRSVKCLIDKGKLVQVDGGLFGETPQQYRLVE
jgi:hypothetical protein